MSSEGWDPRRYQSGHSYIWRFGEGLIDLLRPRAGERILDLGCGSGQLTARIAESGAEASGIDSSEEMIAAARANFPSIEFRVADAVSFSLDRPVDAVFSNAVLHWVSDSKAALGCVFDALKAGGRFVFEMGGSGNLRELMENVRAVVGEIGNPWLFPTIGEYATVLEAQGFEIRLAELYDRPTRVEGEHGLDDWLIMFGAPLLASREESEKAAIRRAVANRLRAERYCDGAWTVDYRRLRMIAVKP